MDDLIIRVLGGTASPFEEERLKRWREESPEHEATFQDLARVWELTAPEAPTELPARPSVESILARASGLKTDSEAAKRQADEPSPTGIQPKRAPRPRPSRIRAAPGRWWLLAASVGALSLGVQLVRTRGPELLAVYEGAPGQPLTVNLRDGSLVRLAEGARLREWEGESVRRVSLEGQAFFAVARNEATPFEVRTSGGRVRVLGTRFELQADASSLRVVVVEGRVEVSNPEGRVEVGAGETALAQAGEAPTSATSEDIYGLLNWPEGTLVFQGTPLGLVAEEVTRFFGQPLVVRSQAMEDRRITAWFQGESFHEVADALCQAAGAVCRMEGEGVTIDTPGGEGGTP